MMKALFHTFFLSSLLAIFTLLAQAQQDAPTVDDVNYDQLVEDSITDQAFFDWWDLQTAPGDRIVVEMTASDGLIPLIGLLDVNGDLVMRSDVETVAQINGSASLEYTTQTGGQYRIVATRDGRDRGTSIGSYSLIARRANSLPGPRLNPNQDVEFRCGDFLAHTAATIEYREDIIVQQSSDAPVELEFYRLTVYGLDGFEPVIRVFTTSQETQLDCTDDGQRTVGDRFVLPDGLETVIPEDWEGRAVQLSLRNTGPTDGPRFGTITWIIAGKKDSSGSYIAVLEGLQIEPREDEDAVMVRLGPLARDTAMQVYMIGGQNTRLDPYMVMTDDGAGFAECDDAGKRGCEGTAPIEGAFFSLTASEGAVIQADDLDAGLRLAPGNPDPMYLNLSSRDHSTRGVYTLVIRGELPPR